MKPKENNLSLVPLGAVLFYGSTTYEIYKLIVWELNSKSDQTYAEEQGVPLVQSETDYNIHQL